MTLNLPIPPSVNALSRAFGRRVIKSKVYRDWQAAAGWSLVDQKPGRVAGHYALQVRFCRRETRADLGNLEKAVSDLLQEHGVIANDRLAQRILLEWGAAAGCEVIVTKTKETPR